MPWRSYCLACRARGTPGPRVRVIAPGHQPDSVAVRDRFGVIPDGWHSHPGALLDPAKVTRLALLNAASVAGLPLTTKVMISEAPKDDDHARGAPGGGMGGMEM